MPRIRDIQLRKSANPKSTMAVDAEIANLIRKMAQYEGKMLSDFLNDLLVSYLQNEHPDLELLFDEEDEEPEEGEDEEGVEGDYDYEEEPEDVVAEPIAPASIPRARVTPKASKRQPSHDPVPRRRRRQRFESR